MVVQMINVGETTGALDAMLSKIADFYEEEVDTAVAGLLTLMEPIMIAVLGGVVGGIVIAMYHADLRPDFEADAEPWADDTTTLRRKLLWLIAGRAAVITFLLGSAILVQYSEHRRAGVSRSIRSSR